ncbi:MAG: hypothetical protein U1E65_19180 [Myxococcota bacterium]
MNNNPNQNEPKKIEELSLKEIAELDFKADQQHDTNQGPLLKIKPLLKLKTSIRAGGSIVGLGAA